MHESLWRGRGLEDLLGAREAPCGKLLTRGSNDIAWLLGGLRQEGRRVDGTSGGLRSLPRGLPAQGHLAELRGHVLSQGELWRWRHRQEMLGRKRHSWVLHGLGGSLQPLSDQGTGHLWLGWLDLLLGLRGGLLLGLRLGLPHHRTTQGLLAGWGVVDGGGPIRIHEGLACVWIKQDASGRDACGSFEWKEDVAGAAGSNLAPHPILWVGHTARRSGCHTRDQRSALERRICA